ncbi:MAG: hypothetical protein ABR991_10555 [Terracidiphilus sp.]|jgi:hypothetical protein
MESNLRPLTLGEILDRTAQLYRSNFLLFAGISAVFAGSALALNLVQIGLSAVFSGNHPALWLSVTLWSVLGLKALFVLFLYGAFVAAINRAVSWVHLGEPATIRGAYESILPRLSRYLWLMTLSGLIVFLPIVLLYGGYFGTMAYFVKGFGTNPAAQQAAIANPQSMAIVGIASVIFILLLIPAAIYTILMSLRYSLAVPACVVEDLKARKAIRRSIELSKGSRGRIFVLALMVAVIKLVLLGVTQFFVFIAAFKHPGQPLGPGLLALSETIAFFTNTILGPIFATGITLFYYDQRIRKEGYDIEWMMQAAGLTPPEPVIAPPAAATPTLNGAEIGLPLDGHFEPPPAAQQSPEAAYE